MDDLILIPLKIIFFLFVILLEIALFLPITIAVEVVYVASMTLLIPLIALVNALIYLYNILVAEALDSLIEPLKDNFKSLPYYDYTTNAIYYMIKDWVVKWNVSSYLGAFSIIIGSIVILLTIFVIAELEEYIF